MENRDQTISVPLERSDVLPSPKAATWHRDRIKKEAEEQATFEYQQRKLKNMDSYGDFSRTCKSMRNEIKNKVRQKAIVARWAMISQGLRYKLYVWRKREGMRNWKKNLGKGIPGGEAGSHQHRGHEMEARHSDPRTLAGLELHCYVAAVFYVSQPRCRNPSI